MEAEINVCLCIIANRLILNFNSKSLSFPPLMKFYFDNSEHAAAIGFYFM